ncbi:MAG: CBS domain-containing protein [Lachnospiraceae bacterium]|nr:CBS domain-containing protein [Lachnospiraceae bacterium]
MNVLFFLTPKAELSYVYDDETLRQALEKMEYHRYTSIPMLNRKGEYIGTITEGDILFYIKNEFSLNFKDSEKIHVKEVDRRRYNAPIRVDADIEDLIQKATTQNFVPVIDDKNSFIGIVTRQDIIQYCTKRMRELEAGK